jgi:hypothetical protein
LPRSEGERPRVAQAGLRFCDKHRHLYDASVGCQSCEYEEWARRRSDEKCALVRNPLKRAIARYLEQAKSLLKLESAD